MPKITKENAKPPVRRNDGFGQFANDLAITREDFYKNRSGVRDVVALPVKSKTRCIMS